MKFRFVIIDEPIHIEDKMACRLWQQSLWAKDSTYREHYKNSILPLGVDDFFGTHLIVAEEKPNGKLVPASMYKSVRRSQAKKFKIPFGVESILQGTKFEGNEKLRKVLEDPSEISYDSSWAIAQEYKKHNRILRDYMTVFGCMQHRAMGFNRWVTAGIIKGKIDKYFESIGGETLISKVQLPIINNEFVRMIYVPDTRIIPEEPAVVVERLSEEWQNRILFSPRN